MKRPEKGSLKVCASFGKDTVFAFWGENERRRGCIEGHGCYGGSYKEQY